MQQIWPCTIAIFQAKNRKTKRRFRGKAAVVLVLTFPAGASPGAPDHGENDWNLFRPTEPGATSCSVLQENQLRKIRL